MSNCPHKTVQTDECFCPRLSATERLAMQSRPIPGIFQSAYSSISQTFPRLIYKGKLFQMTCLPFGLSTAPRVYAILTNWVAETLRRKGIRILVYLDDFLVAHQEYHILQRHIQKVLNRLTYLGWQINYKISVITLGKSLVFLSIKCNPWQNERSLPVEKVFKIKENVENLLHKHKVTLKELQSFSRSTEFCQCHCTKRQNPLSGYTRLPKQEGEGKCDQRDPTRRGERGSRIEWWSQKCHRTSLIHYPMPTHFLTTDASDQAWGGPTRRSHTIRYVEQRRTNLHCNQKEMLAIEKTIKSRGPLLQRSTVLVQRTTRLLLPFCETRGGGPDPSHYYSWQKGYTDS